MAVVPKGFSGMYIGDMHFYRRSRNAGNGVSQGYRRMGVGACIQYDAVFGKPFFMQLVEQGALGIGLEIAEGSTALESIAQIAHVGFKSLRTVDFGLSNPQQIEVGAVDVEYLFYVIDGLYGLLGLWGVGVMGCWGKMG